MIGRPGGAPTVTTLGELRWRLLRQTSDVRTFIDVQSVTEPLPPFRGGAFGSHLVNGGSAGGAVTGRTEARSDLGSIRV